MDVTTWIGEVSLEQLKAGFVEDADHYTCLCCGKQFEKGIIYPEDGLLYEAERYTRLHIEKSHGSVFQHLIEFDKRITGLSPVQKNLLIQLYQGKSDAEVQRQLGMGATSTIRNHRFLLRAKERQAKVFLALMELLHDRDRRRESESGSPAKTVTPEAWEEKRLDRKAELKRQAKEVKTESGIYQIRNTKNGKLFVEATRNFRTTNGQLFTLEMGSHMNKALQQEYNEFGKAAFVVEVLEVLEKQDSPYFDERDALKRLKEKWLNQLQPFGERGYNQPREESDTE